MRSRLPLVLVAVLLGATAFVGAAPGVGATQTPATQCAPGASYPAATTPVAFWSTEARCAIVPAGAGGTFGSENFGNKFPGEAAVYMGIVHVAIYDAAVAIEGGYRPYAFTGTAAPETSPATAIATAAYDTLAGLQPQLGGNQAILDADYAAYLAAIPDGQPKADGITVGQQVAQVVLALRHKDGRGCSTTLADLGEPLPGPGVWQPASGQVLGLCLPGMRPLALESASQFRPDGPNALTSQEYVDDFNQVKALGRIDSTTRTPEQTIQARFWTDHDIRQWNDGMLRLAAARGLDLVETARMLAMAHAAGADAMIACFDAKYHYWFWRPYQAIPHADTDGNPATVADPSWTPLGTTPNFPEYPSAHACHSTAVVEALDAFFGTDKVTFTLDSRVTHTTRQYERLHDIVKDVDWARVLVGFHFRNSDLKGSALGRRVGRYVADHHFQPLEGVPPTCTARDRASPTLVSRAGYTLACGPGSAMVGSSETTYRIRHSKCFGHGRLYFGAFRWSRYSQPAPRNSLMLVLESHDRHGTAPVIDGGLELVTGRHTILSGALSGRAHVDRALNRGTFSVSGRSGTANGRRFVGSWNCG